MFLRANPTAAGGEQGSRGGVGLVTRDRMEEWETEYMCFHRINVVSCKVVSGLQRTPLIGYYLPLTTLDQLPDLEDAPNCFPGRYTIVIGDLNVVVGRMGNPRYKQEEELLASFGMVDLLGPFRQRMQLRYKKMCWQVRQGKLLHYRCCYILGSGPLAV